MLNELIGSFHYFGLSCGKPNLFGIPSWYSYLQLQKINLTNPPTCMIVNFSVPGSFINIGLAILDMVLHLAGLVAVGFVIYGGIQLITSRGEPDGMVRARQTIINALVGLVITMVAVGVVAFLGARLG